MAKGIGVLITLIILAMVILVESISLDVHPSRKTKFGTIRGKWMTIRSHGANRVVAAYLGVPYARPPIENLRFKNPKAWKKHWGNIRLAVEDGSMCPQLIGENEVIGNEDCLFLNIFVPREMKRNPDQKYPVLVFVHGGDFKRGSNNSTFYSPDYLLYDNIILVTVNYRLGALGFFSIGDKLAPGNLGLKDIKMALQWIQENINAFDGDEKSVTLWGQDTGAILVHILALTKKTEGLFHRYITSGGSSLAFYAVQTADCAKQLALMAAHHANCIDNDEMGEIIRCLKSVKGSSSHPSEKTFEANCMAEQNITNIISCMRDLRVDEITRLQPYMICDDPYLSYEFTPTIESDSEDAILTTNPLTLIENGHFRDIPWITGLTKDEGLPTSLGILLNNNNKSTELLGSFYYYLTSLMQRNYGAEADITVKEAIDDFYLVKNITETFSNSTTEMIGDALYNWPVYETVKLQSKLMNSSVYFYVLGYEGTFSATCEINSAERYGVAHGDDINYLYPYLNNVCRDLLLRDTTDDLTLKHIMTEMWTSFVKTGVPLANFSPSWEPFQSNESYVLLGWESSTDVTMKQNFLPERMAFWEDLMDKLSLTIYKDNDDDDNIDNAQTSRDTGIMTKPTIIYFFNFFILWFAL